MSEPERVGPVAWGELARLASNAEACDCKRMTIGEVLRGHRHKAGMTQHELSVASGVGVTRISDYERDVKSPRLERFALFCRVLDIDPRVILSASFGARD